jgi:hypothetical protein
VCMRAFCTATHLAKRPEPRGGSWMRAVNDTCRVRSPSCSCHSLSVKSLQRTRQSESNPCSTRTSQRGYPLRSIAVPDRSGATRPRPAQHRHALASEACAQRGVCQAWRCIAGASA